jgi:hypothetical protein
VVNSTGSVFLNGAQLSNSNSFVAGDIVQTKENGIGSDQRARGEYRG